MFVSFNFEAFSKSKSMGSEALRVSLGYANSWGGVGEVNWGVG